MPAVLAELDPLTILNGIPAHPGKSCSGCTLCCEIVPVAEIGLDAFTRCPKLTGPPALHTGCSIYDNRPSSCRRWSCTWLISDLPPELKPNRCGIVLDPLPETILVNGEPRPAAQVWVSRGHEDDWQTSEPIRNMIGSVLETGLFVLWMMPPTADGRRLARAFSADPEHPGSIGYSEPFEQNLAGLPGKLKDPGARLQAAQELLLNRRGR